MLELKHIVRLQLDRTRLAAHNSMPLPSYVNKPLIGQFTILSDAILTGLLNIDPGVFRQQLKLARDYGASFLGEDISHRPIGISATTSLIKTGSVMTKSLIVPEDFLHFDRRLSDHIVIGAFIRGSIDDKGILVHNSDVEVAGWATADDIQRLQALQPPPTFQTKLRVITVPCKSLRPIETLLCHIDTNTIGI